MEFKPMRPSRCGAIIAPSTGGGTTTNPLFATISGIQSSTVTLIAYVAPTGQNNVISNP